MAERDPAGQQGDADDFGSGADPALARLLRDLDALWGSPQPPASLERAITRLAQRPLPPRRFPLRRVLEVAAAVVVVGLVAGLIATLALHGSPAAPATGVGQPSNLAAGALATPSPAATPTPIIWPAPGTIQALGGSGLAGSVAAYSLPSGQLSLSIDLTTGPSPDLGNLAWSLEPGDCAAWVARGTAVATSQPRYQFTATRQRFRLLVSAPSQSGPLALTAIQGDTGARAACVDLAIQPYTAIVVPPSAAPASCPVTRPPSPPFIPPSDYVPLPGSPSEFWYGNAGLFVLLPSDGSWVGLPYHDGAYGQKVFWGHQGYDYAAEPQPAITVTGRRLDAPAPPLTADSGTNAASPEMGSMMLTGVGFPTRGCWEISGAYQGNTLSFVVWLGSDNSAATPGATPAPATPDTTAAPCRAADVRLALGQPIAEPTGQHSLALTLTNRSTQPCSLDGYPTVSLFDATGRVLPFDYQHHGDQVVTSQPPQPVALAPGGMAYVTFNKYRCDSGDQGTAAGLRLALPGDSTPLDVALPQDTLLIGYCGPGDPGTTVQISPVAATFQATLAKH